MSFEPTDEMKSAYLSARVLGLGTGVALADLAQHAMAAALELQFTLDHDCLSADECKNRHHKRTKADWLRLADEKLRK